MGKSELEEMLATKMVEADFPSFEREYRFHPVRRWRADFAFIDQRIMVEVEGGTFVQGRHTTGVGFEQDCIKYSNGAARGWRIIRVTRRLIENGTAMELIEEALNWSPEKEEAA